MEFSTLKIGETVYLNAYGYTSFQIYAGVVVKLTKTRVTVKSRNFDYVFTFDGYRYPRESGMGGNHIRLVKQTDESTLSFLRSYFKRTIKSQVATLAETLTNDKLDAYRLDELREMNSLLKDVLSEAQIKGGTDE